MAKGAASYKILLHPPLTFTAIFYPSINSVLVDNCNITLGKNATIVNFRRITPSRKTCSYINRGLWLLIFIDVEAVTNVI